MSEHLQDKLLTKLLQDFLGHVEPSALAQMRQHLEWVEIEAGATLMQQGDPGDSMYLSVSGRLRAYETGESGEEQMLSEMSRGQVIGELSLYTSEPRSATVVAVRDSVLVRLGKAALNKLVASNAQLSFALTRHIIARLKNDSSRNRQLAPVIVALMPVTKGDVDLDGFARQLAEQLGKSGRVALVDADSLDRALEAPGLARSDMQDVQSNRRIALYLDQLETEHDFVLLVSDPELTFWTRRCSRQSDEILLLADARQPVELHDIERRCLMQAESRSEAAEILVLLHPADLRAPHGTQHWLARRPVTDHMHIRAALPRDMARLSRMLRRTAVGLVLAGGGARGISHLGIFRALEEQGIDIDYVGGTSIGAIMAALLAADRPLEEVTAIAREAFSTNPTGDFNWVPLISLISGKRLKKVVQAASVKVMGRELCIEDMWKNYYSVASNYTQACVKVSTTGDLLKSMLASASIPGVMPPVLLDGDLLCDGGTFNNFPVDVMRKRRGVGSVIGVDLRFHKPRSIDLAEVPGNAAMLRDRLRPRGKRRFRLPSLLSFLMNVTVLYSSSRQQESARMVDLYLNPPLARVGMLQWKKFDSIVDQGYEYGREHLAALPPQELLRYKA